MPNHVTSDLTIKGDAAQVKALVALMTTPESAFDFNAILPMPPVLAEVITGGCTINGKHVNQWLERKHDNGDVENVEISEATLAKWQRDFGARDWYEWANKHWGTKWNAYSVGEWTSQGDTAHIRFDSAWDIPRGVLRVLCAKFPRIEISVWVSGEVDKEGVEIFRGKEYADA